jgi:phosphatidylinositol alpha-mannosyltransferase
LNIGLFAPYDLARAGGVGSHIRAQARPHRARGHDLRLLRPASAALPDGEVALGRSLSITFGGTASGMGIDPRAIAQLRHIFATERFDIVHVHEPLMPAVPWWTIRHARSPIVGTFHVHREHGHTLYRLARPVLAPLMRRISARIAVSDAARRTVADFFPGDYTVIPNGIEPARFQEPRPRPARLPANNHIVLAVGRLEPRKGVDVLVDAMSHLQRRVPDAALVVVGDGPDRASLARLAERCGARVTFCRDVDDDELPAFYQAADIVCAPARGGESFGIVLLEALASGTPVVASRIDGYAAVAGRSPAVRLFEPGDARELSDQLAALLDRPADRVTLRQDAMRLAGEYDWSVQARRIVDVYDETRRRANV